MRRLLLLCSAAIGLAVFGNMVLAADIHTASRRGDLRWALDLLAADSEQVNATDPSGSTPLHYAAQGGHLEVAGALVDREARVNARNREGATPLHDAIAHRQKEMVQFLLDNGADVNARRNNGVTPLMVAARYGLVEIATLLMDKGANLTETDSKGRTAESVAIESSNQDIADAIRSRAISPGGGSGPIVPPLGFGSIVVSVTDPDEKPVKDASIAAGSYSGITDSGGTVVLSDITSGMYTLTISKEGYDTVTREDVLVGGGRAAQYDIVLNPQLGSLTGEVRDHTGAVVAEATVAVPDSTYSSTTGSDGRFSILMVKPGKYSINVTLDGEAVLSRSDIEVEPGKETSLTISLPQPPIRWGLIALIAGGSVALVVVVIVVIMKLRGRKRKPRAEFAGYCLRCGRGYYSHENACANCGSSFTIHEPAAADAPSRSYCTNCGAELDQGSRFCLECGQPVEQTHHDV